VAATTVEEGGVKEEMGERAEVIGIKWGATATATYSAQLYSLLRLICFFTAAVACARHG
jgi:hypothetical protein